MVLTWRSREGEVPSGGRVGGWGGESVYCLFWHLKATCTLWLKVLFLHLSHQQRRVESFSRPLFWLPLASLGLLSYSAFPLSEPVTTLGSLRRTTHLRNLNWSVSAQLLAWEGEVFTCFSSNTDIFRGILLHTAMVNPTPSLTWWGSLMIPFPAEKG